MPEPALLPDGLADRPFRVADALRAGVNRERLRRSDLDAPFPGVRVAAAGGGADTGATALRSEREERDALRRRAGAYATRMPSHHVYAGVTAARLWGLPLPTRWKPDEELVIARSRGTTRGRAAGTRHIEVDRERLLATVHHGLRLLTPFATAITLAHDLSHEQLVHIADALLTTSTRYPDLDLPTRPHGTPELFAARLRECSGLRGVPAMRAAAADARPGVDSRYESITRRTIVRAGLPEPLVHPLVVVDGIELHPDLGYPALKVAVEYEGEGHLEPKQWARDILRYEMLEAAGWIVVRITKADLARDGERVMRRVRSALTRHA